MPPAAELVEVRDADTTPMGAAPIDLGSAKYTEREFYAKGKANRYRGALPNTLETAKIIDGDWPYQTRVLVRTPEASRFNGTLVVEWTNVTAGQDVDFAFAESYEYFLREGYAVAVVSAQKVGVDRLKTWSPKRYGTLSVDAGNVDPQGGGNIDDCRDQPTCPGDVLSWDILTQVSKALKDNAGARPPLPGLKVERVIALGQSQSASRLTIYYNTIQPIYKFFDGFVLLDLAGQLRPDQSVPAISVNSEVTAAAMFPPTTTSKFTRVWAVPGASHASLYGAGYVDAMLVRDKSFPGPNGPMSFTQVVESQNCNLNPLFSTVDHGLVLNAALDAVNKWIKTGTEAAPSRQIQRDASGAVIRNADGMAQGGIQIAQFAAPTAHISMNGTALFCVLSGHHRDFTAAELKTRYGTHENYVAQVRSVMQKARQDGYILPFDEQAAIKAAEESNVAD
jgi:hypothetical protein